MFRYCAALIAIGGLMISGCTANQVPLASSGAASTGSVTEVYRLASGDKLRMTVFNEPTLTTTESFTVGTDGTVSFPLIGPVKVGGLTLRDAEQAVAARYADGFLNNPRVNLDMSEFRPFYILGEVKTPGEYSYMDGLTVNQAVAKAGGFTYRANERRVFIKRTGESSETEVPIAADTRIYPGDTIRVLERFF